MKRYGICKICGKKFVIKNEVKNEEFNIKEYWCPDICQKCKNKNKV